VFARREQSRLKEEESEKAEEASKRVLPAPEGRKHLLVGHVVHGEAEDYPACAVEESGSGAHA
jgi:hypothetical protein